MEASEQNTKTADYAVSKKAGEEAEAKDPPYCAICDKNTGHVTKDCKYNRMVIELKEKDNAARGSEPSKHVFHSASHEIAPHQTFSHPYIPTSISAFQQPSHP